MSVITAKVAGVDRTDYILKSRSPNWEDILNTRGTGGITFEVPYADLASFRPQDGQTVQVIEDGTVRFGGFLVEPALTDLIDEEIVIFDCGMKDNNSIADRRVITAEYDEVDFADIVADILSPAGGNDGLKGEGITDGGVATGPALSISFPTIYVVEALNDLAVAVGGWWWNIGHDKDMDFADRTTLSAPGPLTGANTLKKTPTVRPVLEKYRNIEYVLAGKDDFPIAAGYWASGEVVARAALEGTTGRYEHIEERQDILDPVIAGELAEDLVERFGTVTKYFQCVTRDPGYKSGQEVDLTFPALDLAAETFLIDSVNAQVVYTSEDGTDIQEIWYTITAITGDPFGGWMEHFRKRPGPTQKRKIVPAPGLQFECDPGVLLHDPPAGPYEWFQGAASGTLDSTPGCPGITHELPGEGGWYLCARRGPMASPRQSYVEMYAISDVEGVATTPSYTINWDELNASAFKTSMVVKPNNAMAAVIERDSLGGDPVFILVNLLTKTKSGHVDAVGLVDNNDFFEGAWVGDYVYIPEPGTGSVFVFDVSSPANPTLEDEFSTSLAAAKSVVPSDDGTYLFVTGNTNTIVALDITDPTNISEVDTATVTGTYNSIDLRTNPADDLLVGFQRAGGADVRYLILPVTVGGGASTFGTPIEGTVALATSTMDGYATVFDGSTAHTFAWKPAPTSVNAQKSYTFELNTAETAFTLLETFSYNHTTSGNLGPERSTIGNRVIQTFGFNTDAQITYGQADYVCTELETQWPLEADFGGTGFKTYDKGDLLAGDATGVLGRQSVGVDESKLTADNSELYGIRWEQNELWNVVEIDGDVAPYTVVDGDDVILAEPTSGEMTIDLPALSGNLDRVLAVKNVGDGSWGVVVDPDSTELIDGASTLDLDGEDEAAIFVAGLTQWDIIATKAAAGSAGDHGLLSGLSGDDHPHYLLADGSRALTADWGVGGFSLGTTTSPASDVYLENLGSLWIEDLGGTARQVVRVDAANITYLGSNIGATYIRSGFSSQHILLNSGTGLTTFVGDVGAGDFYGDAAVIGDGGSGSVADSLIVYGSDDGTNYERLRLRHSGSLCQYLSEKGGTGTARAHSWSIGGTEYLQLTTAGDLMPIAGSQQLGNTAYPWQVLAMPNLGAVQFKTFAGTLSTVLTVNANDHIFLGNSTNFVDTIIRSGYGDHMRFEAAGEVCIGTGNSHTQVTTGLVIGQGAADDFIIAFESSDVVHGITTVVQTDTFGAIKKFTGLTGGVSLQGFTEDEIAVELWGTCTNEDTTKSTAAVAPCMTRSSVKSGTDRATMTANANIFVARDHNLAQFIVEQDGELHCNLSATITDHAGHVTEYDEWDDLALVTGFRGIMLGKTAPDYLRTFVEYARPVLEAGRVVTFNEDGNHFVALKALHALTLDTIIQVGGRVRDHDWRIRELEAKLAELKAGA